MSFKLSWLSDEFTWWRFHGTWRAHSEHRQSCWWSKRWQGQGRLDWGVWWIVSLSQSCTLAHFESVTQLKSYRSVLLCVCPGIDYLNIILIDTADNWKGLDTREISTALYGVFIQGWWAAKDNSKISKKTYYIVIHYYYASKSQGRRMSFPFSSKRLSISIHINVKIKNIVYIKSQFIARLNCTFKSYSNSYLLKNVSDCEEHRISCHTDLSIEYERNEDILLVRL